jgi:Ras family protein T1
VLDNEELNEFQVCSLLMTQSWLLKTGQRKCFDAPLQLQELEGIKVMVQGYNRDAVHDDGLTEAGFLLLHTIFIQRGRLETTWTVLRKHGYAEDLRLSETFLSPQFANSYLSPPR